MLTAVIFLPSASLALGKDFAECRFLALGKKIFADKIFVERPLPSAALGKAFAECLAGFAKCPQHSAKRASAVVVAVTLVVGPATARGRLSPSSSP
jgi:hypothetical protein